MIFANLQSVPPDPILGVTEAFNDDPSPQKVNLGVGVYLDEQGKLPLLACVRQAEQDLAGQVRPRGYLPQTGLPAFDKAAQEIVFGAGSEAVESGRVVTCQALAGTGALRVGAGLLYLADPVAHVWLSDPSWENHELLFTRAGFATERYRYYDAPNRRVDADAMIDDLGRAPAGSIVVLHACCHNPTGYDLSDAEWDSVAEVTAARQLVPFIDMAYQGFARGVEQDRHAIEVFARQGLPFLVAQGFSKTFSLYGERIGAIHVVATDAGQAARVASQIKTVVRSLYSNPPTQGAAIVAAVLNDEDLRALWERELAAMRDRVIGMRRAFRSGLEARGVAQDVSYMTAQTGLFSYSGLSTAQMRRLRSEFHVYGLDSGRLCMAGLNPGNVDYAASAVAEVMIGG